jgi:hypothetical protein
LIIYEPFSFRFPFAITPATLTIHDITIIILRHIAIHGWRYISLLFSYSRHAVALLRLSHSDYAIIDAITPPLTASAAEFSPPLPLRHAFAITFMMAISSLSHITPFQKKPLFRYYFLHFAFIIADDT